MRTCAAAWCCPAARHNSRNGGALPAPALGAGAGTVAEGVAPSCKLQRLPQPSCALLRSRPRMVRQHAARPRARQVDAVPPHWRTRRSRRTSWPRSPQRLPRAYVPGELRCRRRRGSRPAACSSSPLKGACCGRRPRPNASCPYLRLALRGGTRGPCRPTPCNGCCSVVRRGQHTQPGARRGERYGPATDAVAQTRTAPSLRATPVTPAAKGRPWRCTYQRCPLGIAPVGRLAAPAVIPTASWRTGSGAAV